MNDRSSILATAFRMLCDVECVAAAAAHTLGLRRSLYSQKRQDAWVTARALPGKRQGFFVELGAGDGITHSNTLALETYHDWSGLLIEANPSYCEAIRKNRRSKCVEACIDAQDGEADFFPFGYLGGIVGDDTDNSKSVRAALLRKNAPSIKKLITKTLEAVLDEAQAPKLIDYFSIDIEGAELRVLSSFPFHRYRFGALTVERPNQQLHDLLTRAGYVLDKVYLYDGFYVPLETAQRLEFRRIEFHGIARRTY